jgi:hypothetical protein
VSSAEPRPGVDGLGRRILLALGGGTILLGGLLGFFVGANGAAVLPDISVFGLFRLPLTPWTMAGYGMGVVALAIVLLYGAIALASRYDTGAV